MAERRPTLTASARVGVRNHGRGGRKPAARIAVDTVITVKGFFDWALGERLPLA